MVSSRTPNSTAAFVLCLRVLAPAVDSVPALKDRLHLSKPPVRSLFIPRRSRPGGTQRLPPASARRAPRRRDSLSTERASRRWPRLVCVLDWSTVAALDECCLPPRPSLTAGALSNPHPHGRKEEEGERYHVAGQGGEEMPTAVLYNNLLFLLSIALETAKRNRGRGSAGPFFLGQHWRLPCGFRGGS